MNFSLSDVSEKGKSIRSLYNIFFEHYGPQGWWPLEILKEKGSNGYHPGDFSFPETSKQVFEIGLGAILTQNTNWKQVEKTLSNLKEKTDLIPENILKADVEDLKAWIKPSGFFNMKVKKIILFTKFFISLEGKVPSREELLALWGVGEETADSILLYGYKAPVFVIDNYTIRIFKRLSGKNEKLNYTDLQNIIFKAFKNMPLKEKVVVFSEYHALFVKHAKEYCRNKPLCNGCILREHCLY
ncbi:MAG: endonuclease III domain-containing protein [Acidobacteriota bacterium]